MITVEEYFEKLRLHDWYYHYSDDYQAYSKGNKEHGELEYLSSQNELFAKMFDDYLNFINAGIRLGPDQTEVSLPKLEDYL